MRRVRPVVAAMTVTSSSPQNETRTDSFQSGESIQGQHMPETTPSSSNASVLSSLGGKSNWAIDESEELTSNLEHRMWTFGSMALMAGSLVQACLQAHYQGDMGGLTVVLALLVSYVSSDLGTGIYHWSVDNYGDGKTPLVGKQIAAFQVGVIFDLYKSSFETLCYPHPHQK